MDATDTKHIISLGFESPRLETRYAEIKHKHNHGIEALSTKTHVIDVINIWKMNIRNGNHTEVKTLTTSGMSLNLEDEILVRG
jgi:hypothetical protein